MGAPEEPLKELEEYIGKTLCSMQVPLKKLEVESILEKTVIALEAGATPEQIKEVFAQYISAWQPDRSYG